MSPYVICSQYQPDNRNAKILLQSHTCCASLWLYNSKSTPLPRRAVRPIKSRFASVTQKSLQGLRTALSEEDVAV